MKILKFFKEECAPCDELELPLSIVCDKFNIDLHHINNTTLSDLAKQYHVFTNPTIILLNNDIEVYRHIGIISEEELTKMVQQFL